MTPAPAVDQQRREAAEAAAYRDYINAVQDGNDALAVQKYHEWRRLEMERLAA